MKINQQDVETPWTNGITLKKTRDGYTWTISVAADGNTPEDMQQALDLAATFDARLRVKYGEPDRS